MLLLPRKITASEKREDEKCVKPLPAVRRAGSQPRLLSLRFHQSPGGPERGQAPIGAADRSPSTSAEKLVESRYYKITQCQRRHQKPLKQSI